MGKKAYLKETAEILSVAPYYLRQRAMTNTIPFLKSGNRYIFDIELCQEFLKNEALANVHPADDDNNQYGKLRRVNA